MVLGLVLGVVFLLVATGIGAWYLFGDGSQAENYEFPDNYEPTVEAAPPGGQYTLTESGDFDLCTELELDVVEKVLPFAEDPKGQIEAVGDGTGNVRCTGTLLSDVLVEGANPNGTFHVVFSCYKDSATAEEDYDKIWDMFNEYDKALGSVKLGDEAEARYKQDDETKEIDLAVAFRSGNLDGLATIGVDPGSNPESPDEEMLVNVLVDLANSGMNTLAEN